jgi:hypothetical protein
VCLTLDIQCTIGTNGLWQEFDTEFPLNVNDADFGPDSAEPPKPREGVSEITFCLIRYEIARVYRKLCLSPLIGAPGDNMRIISLEIKEKFLEETRQLLEDKYLQYCDRENSPLYTATATVARLIIQKLRLVIHQPFSKSGRSQLTKEKREMLLLSSVQIIEFAADLEKAKETRKWVILCAVSFIFTTNVHRAGSSTLMFSSTLLSISPLNSPHCCQLTMYRHLS